MKSKYILGNGISALIYKFYNPEFKVIGIKEELGGKLKNDFMKNTILLHDTKDTEELLKDLEIEIKKVTHLIKYVENNTTHSQISLIKKLAFIIKKMNDDNFKIEDVKLSTDDYFIPILNVDFNEIINKLSNNVTIIDEKVIRISDTEIITEKNRYEYSEIVSTLPADIFWNLYYEKRNLEFRKLPVTFVLADELPKVLREEKFNLAYFIDKNIKYSRINKLDNQYLYEFTNFISREDIVQYLPKNANIINYYVDNCGIIVDNLDNIPPSNIKFIGRFANWLHSYKINDSIKASQPNLDFQHLWNIQKTFSNKVINFNDLKTSDKKEELTQSFILHLLEELSEILRETNYKKHSKHIEVDVEKLKEECVDLFKYLLNILLVWDVDAKEFSELFIKKSKIVDERFDKEMK